MILSQPPPSPVNPQKTRLSPAFSPFPALRQELTCNRGFSLDAASLISSSVRESSAKNYDYLIRVYVTWCQDQPSPVDPYSCSVSSVCNFLAWVHKTRNLSQSTMGLYRSAISKIHRGFKGLPIGQTLEVSNLIKGVDNTNPSKHSRQAKNEVTWQVSKVLDFLATLHPPESLSLQDLSHKTLTLVALSSVSRASTLKSMSRHWDRAANASESGENQFRVFFLPDHREKVDSGRRSIFIPPLPQGEEDHLALDPVTYLLAYMEKTNPLLPTSSSPPTTPLWVKSIKPFTAVSSVTLANWLTTMLKRSGINTSLFKAHSTRAASSSFHAKNLSLAQILTRGGWAISPNQTSNTFSRFYNKFAV